MRYFTCEDAYPVEYITSGQLYSKDNFVHDNRVLNENVLIMVKQGVLHLTANEKNYKIKANQYIVLKCGERHYGYKPSLGKLVYNWVHFKVAGSKFKTKNSTNNDIYNYYKLLNDKNGRLIIPEFATVTNLQKSKVLFNQLLDFSLHDGLISLEIMDYSISLLLMELTQEFFDQHNQEIHNIQPNVARIQEWIKANYYKSLSVKVIAEEFGYNPDYLSSLFKRSTSTTLIQYLNIIRINISKSLLINYDISIKEIAYSCGFNDQKYYMKVFKKIEIMTPSQYRDAFTRKKINF